MKYKGSTFLKVMGILCIVFGAIGLIMSALSAATFSVFGQLGLTGGIVTASIGISVISSIIMLVAGILGVANSKKPKRAIVNVVFGVILVVVEVIGIIISMQLTKSLQSFMTSLQEQLGVAGAGMGIGALSGGSTGALSAVSLIVPILYLVAAIILKGNATDSPDDFSANGSDTPGGFDA